MKEEIRRRREEREQGRKKEVEEAEAKYQRALG